MDMLEASRQLAAIIADQSVLYIRSEPFLPDFTVYQEGEIIVSAQGGREIRFPLSRQTIPQVKTLLEAAVQDESKTVIGWGIKNIFSYVLYACKPLSIPKFFDLKVIENFYGIYDKPPATLEEAAARFSAHVKDSAWRSVYEKVYVPLISRVLPAIEVEGLIDTNKKQVVHTYYDLEAQVNGRMNSYALSRGFNAHGMGKPGHLKPRGDDRMFLYFDMASMEVTMLQWLSKDPKLGAIIKSGRDVYETTWKLLMGTPCNDVLRKLIKEVILATIYGQGPASLSKELAVPEEKCAEFIHKTKELFPVAFGFLSDCQKSAIECRTTDVLGRPRTFLKDKLYVIRNFVVQSPSAMVCLEKLVTLFDAIGNSGRIVASVHDGYSIVCHKAQYVEVVKSAREALESESLLCPGLKFRIACKVGERLDQLMAPVE